MRGWYVAIWWYDVVDAHLTIITRAAASSLAQSTQHITHPSHTATHGAAPCRPPSMPSRVICADLQYYDSIRFSSSRLLLLSCLLLSYVRIISITTDYSTSEDYYYLLVRAYYNSILASTISTMHSNEY